MARVTSKVKTLGEELSFSPSLSSSLGTRNVVLLRVMENIDIEYSKSESHRFVVLQRFAVIHEMICSIDLATSLLPF